MRCDGSVGENGEKVSVLGDDMGITVDESGGDIGLCIGGGVTDSARGVAKPEEVGEAAGDGMPEVWFPFVSSDASGELGSAAIGFFSTSSSKEVKNVGASPAR